MWVWKKSMVSGREQAMFLPITNDELERWQNGELIQNAMPQLNDEQREFLMTGITPSEWGQTFGNTK